jgi:demethylmenaquinone methyltransferase/2-methoxy-6-polyprenyl-1,4-benzoquinol methylase
MKSSNNGGNQGNIRKMFKSIADRYDLLNTLITFGRDGSWRRYVVKEAFLKKGALLLDIGTGTGKILQAALLSDGKVKAIGADFTMEMMLAGEKEEKRISWCCADALDLPFKDSVFDAVTSGYLMRNVTDIRRAFMEQTRTVRPGGRVVCLETSPPVRNFLKPFVMLHFKIIIPMLGLIFAGNRNAYRYLTSSTEKFHTPMELGDIMRSAGMEDIKLRRFMFGTIAVLSGTRQGK